jgi:RNA polymerase sigma-70 factor (ECF subfamily)
MDDPYVQDLDLERLFSEHAQPLYGFLAYRVGDPTIAEDLLGDTFERIVRSHARFNARKGSESAWIYTIAMNCLRDHARRAKAEGRAFERAGDPGELFQDSALSDIHERDELQRALARLEPAEREILALRYGADLRLQDIAAVTGLATTTVQGRLYSGLRKLRETLEPARASPSPSRST